LHHPSQCLAANLEDLRTVSARRFAIEQVVLDPLVEFFGGDGCVSDAGDDGAIPGSGFRGTGGGSGARIRSLRRFAAEEEGENAGDQGRGSKGHGVSR